MPPSFRVGTVVNTPEGLFGAIEDGLVNPVKNSERRQNMVDQLFYCPDGHATERAVNEILEFAEHKI